MSELKAWILTLLFMASAGWFITEVLRLTSPHLTVRQRWEVFFWLLATAGAINLAWEVGS